MFISLISAPFVTFSAVTVLLVTALRGGLRQIIFLIANALFVFAVLGAPGFFATIAFCALGYAIAFHFWSNPDASPWPGISVMVAVFIYLRNYEILGFVLPDDLLMTAIRTIGLSFILFKILHVLIDLRGGAIRNFGPLTFLNYCLNFTTFMMGPIQRYQDYADQWYGRRQAIPLTFEAHLDAVLRILIGLLKAYVVGAFFGDLALKSDTDVAQLSLASLAIKLWAFYFFLYMNFSGYCDVVIGLGSLLGIRPPENFNLPFLAQNMSDFWLRQHRSLTLWLTDYVFTPTYKWALEQKSIAAHPVLAGNLAIALTMFVSGIWHGTTIGFLIFGLLHGAYLVIYHTWDHLITKQLGKKRVRELRRTWPVRAIGMVLTFNAAAFAFLFFQLDTPRLMQLSQNILGQ